MNMMELHVSSRPKLSTSYNMEHGDTKVYILIFSRLLRQLSHSASANTSRILEDKIMKICDENIIKTTYYDQ
jgi:hypothetical protein